MRQVVRTARQFFLLPPPFNNLLIEAIKHFDDVDFVKDCNYTSDSLLPGFLFLVNQHSCFNDPLVSGDRDTEKEIERDIHTW